MTTLSDTAVLSLSNGTTETTSQTEYFPRPLFLAHLDMVAFSEPLLASGSTLSEGIGKYTSFLAPFSLKGKRA